MEPPPLPLDAQAALDTLNKRLAFLEDHYQGTEASRIAIVQAQWDWVKAHCAATGTPLPQKFDSNLK